MVEVFDYRVKHPAFALFFWGGVAMILFGALTDPIISNGSIPGFVAIYGMSFLFFGAAVYATLFVIQWWGKRRLGVNTTPRNSG